jgi:hypothetical protein
VSVRLEVLAHAMLDTDVSAAAANGASPSVRIGDNALARHCDLGWLGGMEFGHLPSADLDS